MAGGGTGQAGYLQGSQAALVEECCKDEAQRQHLEAGDVVAVLDVGGDDGHPGFREGYALRQ